ncbi:MAG: hypothetical protein KF910_04660 [Brevundimonas sp.]|uniref:hypothetical protein n=1 Tax=Brevundimonas sp. TaxID=1871086 RepID=UPI0025C292C3|nr:hypothetical protein [Brevundimonas sp.]MBX3476874.1 hypothetical protein [Brevundimonas sp.]
MGVPVNGADFGADRAFEPAGPDLVFSLPPMMLAALVVLGLALFALGWFLNEARSPRRADAADAIWKAVDDALKAAMKADGAGLAGKAEDLRKVLSKRLGATLKLAGGLGDLVQGLDRALDGERHDPHGNDHHPHRQGHGDEHHGHGDHQPHDDPAQASAAPGPVTQVTIINGAPGRDEKGGHDDHNGPHTPSPLSPRERDHALRLAVADLNEHWRHKAERIGELRAAHRELSAD